MHRPLLLTAAMIAAGAATAFAQVDPAPRWQLSLTGGAGLIGVQHINQYGYDGRFTDPVSPATRPFPDGSLSGLTGALTLGYRVLPRLSIQAGVMRMNGSRTADLSPIHRSPETLIRSFTGSLMASTLGLAYHQPVGPVDLSVSAAAAWGRTTHTLATTYDGPIDTQFTEATRSTSGVGGIGGLSLSVPITRHLVLRSEGSYRRFGLRKPEEVYLPQSRAQIPTPPGDAPQVLASTRAARR